VLSHERQSAQTLEIKNVAYTCMALNTSKCNCLTPLHFKGLRLFGAKVTQFSIVTIS